MRISCRKNSWPFPGIYVYLYHQRNAFSTYTFVFYNVSGDTATTSVNALHCELGTILLSPFSFWHWGIRARSKAAAHHPHIIIRTYAIVLGRAVSSQLLLCWQVDNVHVGGALVSHWWCHAPVKAFAPPRSVWFRAQGKFTQQVGSIWVD